MNTNSAVLKGVVTLPSIRLFTAFFAFCCCITYAAASTAIMTFPDACVEGPRARIAAVGDIIFQPPLQRDLFRFQRRYVDTWVSLRPLLRSADIVYGNLEGPVTGDKDPSAGVADLSGWRPRAPHRASPMPELDFNYHTSLLDDLVHSGFKVLSTANNHALDRGPDGIDRTIENLERRGIAWTGTRRRGDVTRPWSSTVDARGVRVAWLACTYGTNGRSDEHSQVLHCYEQRDELIDEVRRLARDPSVHAVVVVPHWGLEDSAMVEIRQERLAVDLIDAGALAIIGAHPHVLQAWEQRRAVDGRTGLVIYSTGNFISNQRRPAQRRGMIVLLDLVLPPGSRTARIAAVGYVATEVTGQRALQVRALARPQPVAGIPFANRLPVQQPLRLPHACALR